MALRFNTQTRTKPKFLINLGAGFDIPTGSIIIGRKGESIINGGLGYVTGVVGAGNNYKSTIIHYMMLSAGNVIRATHDTGMVTYDTEVNITIDGLERFANKFPFLPNDLITGDDRLWEVTDKAIKSGNKWVEEIFTYIDEKVKDKSLVVKFTGFTDPYTKKEFEGILPTFAEIDSATEFESDTTINMLTGDLDDSSTNTYAIKQGGFKAKTFSRLPALSNRSNTFFLMTAHVGEKVSMDTNPMAKYNQPTRKLQYLKQNDNIKGVSTKFTFLLNNAWFAHTASVLKNPSTKLPEYPLSSDDSMETDLNTVKLTQLRSKSGPSGYTLTLVVSQSEGVLPSLTEFHAIKSVKGRYGISGSNLSYHLDLYPDVSLSRTTVRRKIDEDEKLRRAINLTHELYQLSIFKPELKQEGLYCEPSVLYEDIAKLGYDWNRLLESRGYWTIDQYSDKLPPFLSIVDLLKMRKGLYEPYWYKLNKE